MSNKCDKHSFLEGGCPANACEEATVTVPVAVYAYADVGDVVLKCMGPFVVNRNSDRTPGQPGAVSKFTISQRLRVDIPIVFGAEADVGEGYVDFDDCCARSEPCIYGRV